MLRWNQEYWRWDQFKTQAAQRRDGQPRPESLQQLGGAMRAALRQDILVLRGYDLVEQR